MMVTAVVVAGEEALIVADEVDAVVSRMVHPTEADSEAVVGETEEVVVVSTAVVAVATVEAVVDLEWAGVVPRVALLAALPLPASTASSTASLSS